MFFFKRLYFKKFLLSWVSELWIYFVYLISLASILTFIYMCGSGSRKLLNTDPIRIRIHNTGMEFGNYVQLMNLEMVPVVQ